jgi:hypothetical protein
VYGGKTTGLLLRQKADRNDIFMNQEKISGGINGEEPKIDGLKFSLGEAIKAKEAQGAEEPEDFSKFDEDADKLVRAALGEDVFERDEKELKPVLIENPAEKIIQQTGEKNGQPERKINDYEKEVAERLKVIGQDLDRFYEEEFLILKNGQQIGTNLINRINTAEGEIWEIFHKKCPMLGNKELKNKLKPIFDKKKAKAQDAVEKNYA